MPNLGENVESGDIISVLVQEGDEISAEQGVVEVETGKAVVEVPSTHAGKILKIHVKKGDKVPVGTAILSMEAVASKTEPAKAGAAAKPAASAKPPTAPPPQPAVASRPAAVTRSSPPPAPPAERPASRITAPVAEEANGHGLEASPAAPATRRLARELGVDLSRIPGTGPGGRITREDVMTAVREANNSAPTAPAAGPAAVRPGPAVAGGKADRDAFGPIQRVPLTKIRQVIAANMARSHNTIPHVTNFDDADITELERIRKGSMADFVGKNVKLTTMAFILKAVAHALKQHPAINAALDLEQNEAVYKDYVNLGVAVDTERGLVVPVIRDADRQTIPQIAQLLTGIAERARNNQITLDEMRGGTFTISNLGAIGGTYSTPIINFPEVAILLVGRSRQLPVVVEDKIVPRLMCPLSLSYDHRWVDGAIAARFLNEIKGYLEAPARLLLAP